MAKARHENSMGTVLLFTISKYWWENSVIEVGSVWMCVLERYTLSLCASPKI